MNQEVYKFCEKSKRHYLSSTFPKICNCCKRIYKARHSYLEQTELLSKGSYGNPRKSLYLFEYRNCKCGSTLVIKIKEMRDFSQEGIRKRKWIGDRINDLREMGIDYPEAKKKAISEYFTFSNDT